MATNCRLLVTLLHCNFRAACIFIITFRDHMTKIFVVAAMLLSICVVVSLWQRLVPWCIIETQDSDMSFLMFFTTIKQGKFESIPTSSELQVANLLQVAVGKARDTLMNTTPTQSVINVSETFGKFVKFTVEVDGKFNM